MSTKAHVEAFKLLCRDVGSPYALTALQGVLIDPTSASKLTFEPGNYNDAHSARQDYLIYAFLRKYKGDADELVLTQNAVTTYLAVEETNRLTNRRLRSSAPSPLIGNGFTVDSVIFHAREKIADVLGSCDPSKWLKHCEWGPGATATLVASEATVDKKVLETYLSVSGSALKYASAYLETDCSWSSARYGYPCEGPSSSLDSSFQVVDDERFTTVFKDCRSRRSIGIQPTFNLFLQKGPGGYIRKRLKRFRIDLDDQSVNQRLAAVAQDQRLATLDLKGASDTNCTELMRRLLSVEWFTLLDDLRCKSVSIDGVSHRLEKFSAMGNGFTFELESLVFWALAWSTNLLLGKSSDPIGVYGDDIIVSQDIAGPLVACLEWCGFTVNLEKSFFTGRFFESCGRHYFDGIDITPVFQKDILCDLPSFVRCHNRIMRWGIFGDESYRICDSVIRGTVSYLRRRSKEFVSKRRLFGKLLSHKDERSANLYVPSQPWWVQADIGLIRLTSFPSDVNGILRIHGLLTQAVKIRANEYALYSTLLRRGVDSGMASYGYVAPRGHVKTNLATYRFYTVSRCVPRWT